ncbi:hypothetical protein EP331_08965 [bacterium]|nr:MAG: hypothetical protein EP331_08965 [bacterium]
MSIASNNNNIGFYGVSKIVSDTIIENLTDSEFSFRVMDAINDVELESFTGVVIADLTQFENSFEKMMEKLHAVSSNAQLFLIHSYEQIPVKFEMDSFIKWVHTDKVLDELIPILTTPNPSRYNYAV